MYCTSPITIYKRGEGVHMNAATGLPERQMVACGQCKTCQAGRKNDWAGRLIAEASTAKDVYFLTLTYRKEPTDFAYIEVQKMLKHLRTDLSRNHPGTGVRFFCVGEKGNKFGRIHWHLLLFFDRPHMLRRTKPKELWQFWQHGWTSIDHVPQHDVVRRVRYCAKYAVKTVGNDQSCRLRCSLKPAIGGAFLEDLARMTADAALPLKGFFFIPGMLWERGARKGEHVRYRLRGASARNVCRVYAEEWEAKRRNRPWPVTPFFTRYYPQEMTDRHMLWPETKAKFDWSGKPKWEPKWRYRQNGAHKEWCLDFVCDRLWRPAPAWKAKVFVLEERFEGLTDVETQAIKEQFAQKLAAGDPPEKWVDPEHRKRDIRAVDVRAAGLDPATDQAVAFYVNRGYLPQGVGNGPTIRKLYELIDLGSDGERPVFFSRDFEPGVIARRHEIETAERLAKERIWKARQSVDETVNPETGEVEFKGVPFRRGAPDKPAKEVWREDKPYAVKLAALAERAIRRSIGTLEDRIEQGNRLSRGTAGGEAKAEPTGGAMAGRTVSTVRGRA